MFVKVFKVGCFWENQADNNAIYSIRKIPLKRVNN
jgi:hypothetical protein